MVFRKTAILFPLAFALTIWGGHPVSGQDDAESAGLRVSSFSVIVDVVVTDKNNRHVTDLAREDFQVYEDGVPQRVEFFQLVSPRRKRAASDNENDAASLGFLEGPEAAELGSPPNLILMLLDYATVEYLNQGYIREAAIEYVRQHLRPNDLMAVFQVGRSLRFLQNLTNDREELTAALSRMDATGSALALDEAVTTMLADDVQTRVETLTASLDTVSAAGDTLGPAGMVAARRLSWELEVAQSLEGLYMAQRSHTRELQGRPVIGAIESIARAVRNVPGRKTLVLFSQGFSVPMTLERRLFRAVDQANKSNLAVYAVDAGGLRFRDPSDEGELYDISARRGGDRARAYGGLSLFDRAREIGSDQKDSTLRYLAAATGGLLIRHTNDFLGALKRIDRDARTHYVLSYQPSNRDFDGGHRPIEVRTRRPGLTVRARSGYWAIPPGASLLSAEEYRSLLRGHELAAEGASLLLFSQTAYFPAEGDRYSVHLAVELPLEEVSPEYREGFWFVDLDLLGLVQDGEGTVVTSFRGPSRVRLSGGRLGEARSLKLESRLELPPGRYAISLLAEEPGTGRRAFQQRSLLLPAGEPGIRMGSLVLGKVDEIVRTEVEDEFTVRSMRVTPSASRTFSIGEELIYLLNVYLPDSEPMNRELELETALFRGGRCVHLQRIPLEIRDLALDPIPHIKLARYLELDGLAAGRYLLKATVLDSTENAGPSTQTAFRVE
jgi:VWFA-related protein